MVHVLAYMFAFAMRHVRLVVETARREGTASQGNWKVEQFFADWLTKKDSWSWVRIATTRQSLNV